MQREARPEHREAIHYGHCLRRRGIADLQDPQGQWELREHKDRRGRRVRQEARDLPGHKAQPDRKGHKDCRDCKEWLGRLELLGRRGRASRS